MTTMTFPSSAAFNKQALQTYTVGGKSAGLFKAAGNFSYVRVAGAGHEVPAYKVRFSSHSLLFLSSCNLLICPTELGHRGGSGGVPVFHADDGGPGCVLDVDSKFLSWMI
jgi:hypothetical protein